MEANYTNPHLIFTNVGDEANPPYACFSFVGRIGNAGQIINLGSPECLAIGTILHETFHGLGWFSLLALVLESIPYFQGLSMK